MRMAFNGYRIALTQQQRKRQQISHGSLSVMAMKVIS
jgi:hypothetical protein